MEEVKKLVAIVDDESDIKAVGRALLTKAGYSVVLGKTGEEAVDIVKKFNLAALVLDDTMPIMTGLEALKQIKEINQNKTLPILMLTANDEVKMAVEKYSKEEYGRAPEYMGKPFDNQVFVNKVQELTK